MPAALTGRSKTHFVHYIHMLIHTAKLSLMR